MTGKEKQRGRSSIRVPWILLGLSFVFMANPNISVIDLLPDFFGYIMICVALGRISMTCGKLAEAKRAFQKMIFVDGLKLAALVWTFGFDKTAYRGTTLMLVTFMLGVVELIFLIPAYIKLFDGLATLGDYIDNTSVNKHIKIFNCSFNDLAKRASICFVAFKACLVVLPELSNLDNDPISQFDGRVSLYPYINAMRFLSCVVVIAIGIVWFAVVMRYFITISKDKEFNCGISEKYKANVLGRDGFFAWRDIKKACLFLVLAVVFTFDISVEGINYIPDLLSAVMLILAVAYFARTAKISKGKLYTLAYGYAAVSLLSYIADICYYGMNYPANIIQRIAINNVTVEEVKFAVAAYICTVVFGIIEAVLLILLLAELFMEMKKIIVEHTGFVSGKEIEGEMEQAGRKRLWTELEKNFSRTLIAVAVYAFTDVAYSFTHVFEAYVNVNFRLFNGSLADTIDDLFGKDIGLFDTRMDINFGFLWVLNIVAGVVLVFFVLRAVGDLKYSVETKYMIEEEIL